MKRTRLLADLATAFIAVALGGVVALIAPSFATADVADEPAPSERLTPPEPDDGVTVQDGFGRSRSDLTYEELNEEVERLEDVDPADEDMMHLYGLRPDGEIGVIGICQEGPITDEERRRAPLELPPTKFTCGPAPGVEWPAPTTGPDN